MDSEELKLSERLANSHGLDMNHDGIIDDQELAFAKEMQVGLAAFR